MFGIFIREKCNAKKNAVAVFLELKCTKCTDTNDHNVFNRYRIRFIPLQFSGYSIRTNTIT